MCGRFRGRGFLDALVDLPFAVSPIVVGISLILVYGQTGWFGQELADAGIQIIFSWPGIVLATVIGDAGGQHAPAGLTVRAHLLDVLAPGQHQDGRAGTGDDGRVAPGPQPIHEGHRRGIRGAAGLLVQPLLGGGEQVFGCEADGVREQG